MRKNKIRKKFGLMNTLLFILLCVYVLTMLVMFGWGLLTSLKSNVNYQLDPLGLPYGHIWEWKWDNYVVAFRDFSIPIRKAGKLYRINMVRMFINSFVYTIGVTVISSFMQCTMAYLVAKFKYKISKVIYTVVIITMVLPIIGSLPSQMQVIKFLNLYDNI